MGVQVQTVADAILRRSAPRWVGRGVTLIEMAMVLALLGLLAYLFLPMAGALRDQKNRNETAEKLQKIEDALVSYAKLNKRLPCPADATGGNGVALASCPAAADQMHGVLPWATLGLRADDARDAWGNLITYRVALARDWSTPSPYPITNSLGLKVCNGDNAAAAGYECPADPANRTGAAYVLVSHGGRLCGAYMASGNFVNSSGCGAHWSAGLEGANANNQALRTGAATYIDAPFRDTPGSNHFDDLVRWKSLPLLLHQAGLAYTCSGTGC